MYKLPTLPYTYQAFEPYIDTHTMGLHYHKHEQNYLNQLNSLLIKNQYDFRYSLSELLYHINEFAKEDQENILYNLGGVLNHNLYWKSINPLQPQRPFGNLKTYVDSKYGSYDKFWQTIKDTAMKLKGSGYTFLVIKENGQLDIINVANQETPLSYGYVPLFNIDMWEHAYYLNYKNDKAQYLDNFGYIADFTNASNIFNDYISNLYQNNNVL